MSTTPREILIRAKARIEKGFTQMVYARAVDGQPVESTHPEAVNFCSFGAVYAESVGISDEVTGLTWHFLREAAQQLHEGFYDAIAVNDELGKSAALAMFDKAIELAGEEERALA